MSKKIFSFIISLIILILSGYLINWFLVFLNYQHLKEQTSFNVDSFKTEVNNFSIKSDYFDFKKEQSICYQNYRGFFVGDVMLSRVVRKKMLEFGNNYPFLKMTNFLNSFDFVFGNLESPIVEGRDIGLREMFFRAEPGVEKTLFNNNFKVLNLANNHIFNFQDKGIISTLSLLTKSNIISLGVGLDRNSAYSFKILNLFGLKIAFLGYVDKNLLPETYQKEQQQSFIAYMSKTDLEKAVKDIKQNKLADLIIVSGHAGNEYTDKPNLIQTDFYHLAADKQVDLVIGHHPHVIQNLEKYNNKYIFYSLGNFVFDQMWSEKTKHGLGLEVFFGLDKKIKQIVFWPLEIVNYAQVDLDTDLKYLDSLNYSYQQAEAYVIDLNQQKINKTIITGLDLQKQDNCQIKTKIDFDLDADQNLEQIILDQGQIFVFKNNTNIWQSNPQVWVENLGVYKGKILAQIIKFEDAVYSSQLYVLNWQAGQVILKPYLRYEQSLCHFNVQNDYLILFFGDYLNDGSCLTKQIRVNNFEQNILEIKNLNLKLTNNILLYYLFLR